LRGAPATIVFDPAVELTAAYEDFAADEEVR